MSKLISIVGASGVGKTALVQAISKRDGFITAYEQHSERPFQTSFKNDPRYALANQIDYFLLRAEQERELRRAPGIGIMDGGLDLDFHGFTRLFLSRGLLSEPEYDLCRRLYAFLREMLPPPELIVRLCADEGTVAARLSARDRVNIASAQDTAVFNSFLDEWLATVPSTQLVELDVSHESIGYEQSIQAILTKIAPLGMERNTS